MYYKPPLIVVCIFFLSPCTAIKITETRTMYVVTTMVENKEAPCTVIIEMPSGKKLQLTMIRVLEGYTAVFTPTELGPHKFYVAYAEMYIPASPITVIVEVVIEMTKVIVRGLESRKLDCHHQVFSPFPSNQIMSDKLCTRLLHPPAAVLPYQLYALWFQHSKSMHSIFNITTFQFFDLLPTSIFSLSNLLFSGLFIIPMQPCSLFNLIFFKHAFTVYEDYPDWWPHFFTANQHSANN